MKDQLARNPIVYIMTSSLPEKTNAEMPNSEAADIRLPAIVQSFLEARICEESGH
ncbi:hypothetical protein P3T18_007320 [Paraburkholderia sp. GAS199]|uniref:hypothetical protein n=1 Tax=Paraburkholderia sp. GAS199 TaxID=3035126 RepID=UPI003D191E85